MSDRAADRLAVPSGGGTPGYDAAVSGERTEAARDAAPGRDPTRALGGVGDRRSHGRKERGPEGLMRRFGGETLLQDGATSVASMRLPIWRVVPRTPEAAATSRGPAAATWSETGTSARPT